MNPQIQDAFPLHFVSHDTDKCHSLRFNTTHIFVIVHSVDALHRSTRVARLHRQCTDLHVSPECRHNSRNLHLSPECRHNTQKFTCRQSVETMHRLACVDGIYTQYTNLFVSPECRNNGQTFTCRQNVDTMSRPTCVARV